MAKAPKEWCKFSTSLPQETASKTSFCRRCKFCMHVQLSRINPPWQTHQNNGAGAALLSHETPRENKLFSTEKVLCRRKLLRINPPWQNHQKKGADSALLSHKKQGAKQVFLDGVNSACKRHYRGLIHCGKSTKRMVQVQHFSPTRNSEKN